MKLTRPFGRLKLRRRSQRAAVLVSLLFAFLPTDAIAFHHVVQQGETLAGIAKRYYGRIQYERILTAANALDLTHPRGLAPGMLLDVPSLTYHQVKQGETWKSLASEHLGHEQRHIVLAQLNDHQPWIQPQVGQLVIIPYNLSWVATGQESLATLAYRFLGSTKHAYRIVQYNQLKDEKLERGQVLLLPLSSLPLTPEGSRASALAATRLSEQGQGALFALQKNASHEVTQLTQDLQGGRYITAVARGNRLLTQAQLSVPKMAQVQELLLEAYVALDARGPARTACEELRGLNPTLQLDPVTTSPKILQLCPNRSSTGKMPPPVDDDTTSSEAKEK